jgi:exodeoxyribonuclease VII small subunit
MAKAASPIPASKPPVSFEAALEELEAIVRSMEAGGAPLEESLATYERGVALLKHCQDMLTAAESKLQVLEGGTLRDLDAAGVADSDN